MLKTISANNLTYNSLVNSKLQKKENHYFQILDIVLKFWLKLEFFIIVNINKLAQNRFKLNLQLVCMKIFTVFKNFKLLK